MSINTFNKPSVGTSYLICSDSTEIGLLVQSINLPTNHNVRAMNVNYDNKVDLKMHYGVDMLRVHTISGKMHTELLAELLNNYSNIKASSTIGKGIQLYSGGVLYSGYVFGITISVSWQHEWMDISIQMLFTDDAKDIKLQTENKVDMPNYFKKNSERITISPRIPNMITESINIVMAENITMNPYNGIYGGFTTSGSKPTEIALRGNILHYNTTNLTNNFTNNYVDSLKYLTTQKNQLDITICNISKVAYITDGMIQLASENCHRFAIKAISNGF